MAKKKRGHNRMVKKSNQNALIEEAMAQQKFCTALKTTFGSIKNVPSTDFICALPALHQLSVDKRFSTLHLKHQLYIEQFALAHGNDCSEFSNQVSAEISSHFRRVARHVHPDKHGDEMRPAFDAVIEGHSILRDVESRHAYVQRLFVAFEDEHDKGDQFFHDHPAISRAHNDFVAGKEGLDDPDETSLSKLEAATRRQATDFANGIQNAQTTTNRRKRIEAQSYHRSPVGSLTIYSITNLKVKLGLDLSTSLMDVESFRKACHRIVVTAFVTADPESTTIHKYVEGQDLVDLLEGYEGYDHYVMKVSFQLPYSACWSFHWSAEMKGGAAGFIKTQPSKTIERNMRDRHEGQCEALRTIVTKNTASLRATLLRLRKQGRPVGTAELEAQRHQLAKFHRQIEMSQASCDRLCSNLEELQEDPQECREIILLSETLREAVQEKATLQQNVFAGERKDTLKSFRRVVAGEIEKGDIAEWVKNVSLEDIKSSGGEPNRLFQILVDDRKDRLLLNVTALSAASGRDDLFSPKQCKILKKKANFASAEIQRILDEELRHAREKLKAETAAAQEEDEEESLNFEYGENVFVVGLKQRVDLNGQIGVFLGMAPKTKNPTRYIVRLSIGGEVALKKENFVSVSSEQDHCSDETGDESPDPACSETASLTALSLFPPAVIRLPDGASESNRTSPSSSTCLSTVASDGAAREQTAQTVAEFIFENRSCLKCEHEVFVEYLAANDVFSMPDLQEALNCNAFVSEMQENGLKGYQKARFAEKVSAAISNKPNTQHDDSAAAAESLALVFRDGLNNLYCPLSKELMVKEPVVAQDGFTYERNAITAWIHKGILQGTKKILSPTTLRPLENLELRDNFAVRDMALEFVKTFPSL